jgi:hypothetical protein
MRDNEGNVSHAYGISSEINLWKSELENESSYSRYLTAGATVSTQSCSPEVKSVT